MSCASLSVSWICWRRQRASGSLTRLPGVGGFKQCVRWMPEPLPDSVKIAAGSPKRCALRAWLPCAKRSERLERVAPVTSGETEQRRFQATAHGQDLKEFPHLCLRYQFLDRRKCRGHAGISALHARL